jgi:hypothetical protein
MKMAFLILTLVTLSACGGKKSSADKNPVTIVTDDQLTCDLGDVGQSAPKIKIEKEILAAVLGDLQGRPYSREEIWERLGRSTRLKLNLALNARIKNLPEEVVYKGVSLFIEQQLQNPGQSFYFRTKASEIIFHSEQVTIPGGDCKDQEANIAAVNISKVIRKSRLEKTLDCYGPHMHVEVSLFADAVIFRKYFDVYSFAGGELVRTDSNGQIKLKGLAPDQSTLRATIFPGNSLEIEFTGTSDSITGTAMCDQAG